MWKPLFPRLNLLRRGLRGREGRWSRHICIKFTGRNDVVDNSYLVDLRTVIGQIGVTAIKISAVNGPKVQTFKGDPWMCTISAYKRAKYARRQEHSYVVGEHTWPGLIGVTYGMRT